MMNIFFSLAIMIGAVSQVGRAGGGTSSDQSVIQIAYTNLQRLKMSNPNVESSLDSFVKSLPSIMDAVFHSPEMETIPYELKLTLQLVATSGLKGFIYGEKQITTGTPLPSAPAASYAPPAPAASYAPPAPAASYEPQSSSGGEYGAPVQTPQPAAPSVNTGSRPTSQNYAAQPSVQPPATEGNQGPKKAKRRRS